MPARVLGELAEQPETTSRPAPLRAGPRAGGSSRDRRSRHSLRRSGRWPPQARAGDPPVETPDQVNDFLWIGERGLGRLPRPLRLPPGPGRDLRNGPSLSAPAGCLLTTVRGCDCRAGQAGRAASPLGRGPPLRARVLLRPIRRGHDRALRAPHDSATRACRLSSPIRSSPSARPCWPTCPSSCRA